MAETKYWKLAKSPDTGHIWVRYQGEATPTHEINASLAAVTAVLPEKDAKLIMDLRYLTGHNPDSRAPIQGWLMAHKRRIAQVTVLIPSAIPILKLATAAVGLIVGLKLRIAEQPDVPEPAELKAA